jgi:hypothetical protein
MTHRTAAYFLREYRKRFDDHCNMSRDEIVTLIRDAGALSDNGILMLMGLHSRVNDYASLVRQLDDRIHRPNN